MRHFFHLGDLAAALCGVLHAIVDKPPKDECEQPFVAGFNAWGATKGTQ